MDKVMIDGVDVSECEYANACDKKLKCVILQDDVCETKPYCEGYNCYYKQLQRLKYQYADVLKLAKENADSNEYCLQELEKENEELKTLKDMYFTYYKAKHNDVKGEFFKVKKENEHLKKCCTQVGEELEKHSFKWDGKEKNLVVQALELNEQYDKLQAENKELSESIKRLKNMAKAAALGREKYKYTLQEIKKYIAKICKEECGYVQKKRCPDSDCRYGQILAKINEVIIGAE